MPYRTQLAQVARRAGYPVTEVSGWQNRGHGPQPSVQGIVMHHTAGATGGGDYPSLGVVRDGRPDLAGPLSHFGLGRSGRIYVIAAGMCYHNAPSTSDHHSNYTSIGIEAENDGSQPWPSEQLDSYIRLCGELCREFGLPASRVRGHLEVNNGKRDPHSIDLNDFRSQVGRVIAGEDLDDMPSHSRYQGNPKLVVPPGQWRYLPFTRHNGNDLDEVYYSTVFGPALYMVGAAVRFASDTDEETYWPLSQGDEVQMRLVEVIENSGSWEYAETAPINSPVHVAGGGHFTYAWPGNNQADHRVRMQVTHFGERPALVDLTDVSVLSWPR